MGIREKLIRKNFSADPMLRSMRKQWDKSLFWFTVKGMLFLAAPSIIAAVLLTLLLLR